MYAVLLRPISAVRIGTRRWLTRDRHYFLWREVRWTLRFMFKGPGLFWLGAYIVFLIFRNDYFQFLQNRLPVRGLVSGIPFKLAFWLPAGALGFSLWLIVFKKRTASLFEEENFNQLVLTRLGPRDLYPAMLAAPSLSAVLIILACYFPYYLYMMFGRFFDPEWQQMMIDQSRPLWTEFLFLFIRVPFSIFLAIAKWFVISLVAARYTRLHAGWGRIALVGAVVSLAWWLVRDMGYTFLVGLATLAFGSYLQVYDAAFAFHLIHLGYMVVFIILILIVCRAFLRKLRSERDWHRFLRDYFDE